MKEKISETDYRIVVLQALNAILSELQADRKNERIRRLLTSVVEELSLEEE